MSLLMIIVNIEQLAHDENVIGENHTNAEKRKHESIYK